MRRKKMQNVRYHLVQAASDDSDRPSEDDIAQARLGGPRGARELQPAPMTRQRRIKTPEYHTEPGSGHTA
jgi:hypothetical protein